MTLDLSNTSEWKQNGAYAVSIRYRNTYAPINGQGHVLIPADVQYKIQIKNTSIMGAHLTMVLDGKVMTYDSGQPIIYKVNSIVESKGITTWSTSKNGSGCFTVDPIVNGKSKSGMSANQPVNGLIQLIITPEKIKGRETVQEKTVRDWTGVDVYSDRPSIFSEESGPSGFGGGFTFNSLGTEPYGLQQSGTRPVLRNHDEYSSRTAMRESRDRESNWSSGAVPSAMPLNHVRQMDNRGPSYGFHPQQPSYSAPPSSLIVQPAMELSRPTDNNNATVNFGQAVTSLTGVSDQTFKSCKLLDVVESAKIKIELRIVAVLESDIEKIRNPYKPVDGITFTDTTMPTGGSSLPPMPRAI